MNGIELEIIWIACGLLFGFTQAVFAIVLSSSPSNLDEAIDYLDWIIIPMVKVFDVGVLALIFAIIMTWVYAFFNSERLVNFAIAVVLTLLSWLAHRQTRSMLKKLILSRMRRVV